MRKALLTFVGLGSLIATGTLQAQPAVTDPEIRKGVTLVEDGDYDAAIFTLDTVIRRLADDPAKAGDLSQAYLYLGIAYFGKGHEAAAKAKFREAILQMKDISLSAEEYSPKIIDLFEAAREDTRDVEPAPAAGAPEEQKGGSKTPLVLVGVGGAAAAGIAIAAGGGGGGDSGGGGSSSSTPPPEPVPVVRTEVFSGTVDLSEWCRSFGVDVAAEGSLSAEVTWVDDALAFLVYFYTGEAWEGSGEASASSNRITDMSAALEVPVTPQHYIVEVCHDDGPCMAEHNYEEGPYCAGEFNLTVRHP